MTPDRTGPLRRTLLITGPIIFAAGTCMGVYNLYSDGTKEFIFPMGPLGSPLQYVGLACLLVGVVLWIIKRR